MPPEPETSTPASPSSGAVPKDKKLKIEYLNVKDIVHGVGSLRVEQGDLSGLKDSIATYGLMSPLVIDQNNKIVAGRRRWRCIVDLGWEKVPCIRKETVTKSHHHILELSENIFRKGMTWQEECKGVYFIHRHNEKEAVIGGSDWTQTQTSRLLGVPMGSISVILKLGGILTKNPEHMAAKAESVGEAIRLVAQERQRELEEEALRRSKASAPKGTNPKKAVANKNITHADDDIEVEGEIDIDFDLDEEAEVERRSSDVDLSQVCIHGDCIAWMNDPVNASSVDHIVTDPPYAIDLNDFISKEEGGGALGISSIEETHQVDSNLDLLKAFWSAAYKVTRPHSYVVTFACISNWEYCRRCAIEAGFKVQEWPNIWHKPNASLNRMAGLNFTKNYEVAVIARREEATLRVNAPKSVYSLDNQKSLKSDLGLHPFVKPYGVWEWISTPVVSKGQTVLDPFAGVGSSAECFIVQEFKPILIELDENHYRSLVHNVSNFYLDNAL